MAFVIAFSSDSAGTLTIQRLDRTDLAGLGELMPGRPEPEGLEAPLGSIPSNVSSNVLRDGFGFGA